MSGEMGEEVGERWGGGGREGRVKMWGVRAIGKGREGEGFKGSLGRWGMGGGE